MLIPQQILSGLGSTAAPATVTYVGNNFDGAPASTITFTAEPIGTAAADRFVVVAVNIQDNSAGTTAITTMTIGGNNAALLHSFKCATHRTMTAFYGLLVTSGTTADIVVTANDAWDGVAIGVWRCNSLQSETPTDTGGNDTASAAITDTINVSAGGVALAAGGVSNGNTTYTWSAPTERFDVVTDSATDSWSGASLAYASAQSPLTVTLTPAATGTEQHMVCISLR